MDVGIRFLRIVTPFYFVVSAKYVTGRRSPGGTGKAEKVIADLIW